MYIKTKENLDKELSERKKNGEINENINIWMANTYGLENFNQMVKNYFGLNGNGETTAILARHIPSVKVEDIVNFIGTKKLGLKFISPSFYKDLFTVSSWSKASCIKMPILKHEGNAINKKYLYLSCKKGDKCLAPNQLHELNNIPLEKITTTENVRLVDYHEALRARVFNGESASLEFSNFFENCFSIARECGKVDPSIIAFQTVDGLQRKVKVGDVSSDMVLRPSMAWYYPIFFSLFLNGNFVLLETYGNAPGAIGEFEESVRISKEISGGFAPLVIETPLDIQVGNFVSKAMLEYNMNIQDRSALSELVRQTDNIDSDNITEMFYQIAQKAISFKL